MITMPTSQEWADLSRDPISLSFVTHVLYWRILEEARQKEIRELLAEVRQTIESKDGTR